MAEYLDLRAPDGSVTGEVKERSLVHLEGDPHGTAHVWIVRMEADGPALLLQKRSRTKDAYPGCWDVSSAGHLPAGSDFLESALRELAEELGVEARPEELEFIGFRHKIAREFFHGRPFIDDEYAAVYLTWKAVRPEKLRLQAEEVEAVRFFPLHEIFDRFDASDFSHCLYRDELEMVAAACEAHKRSTP